MRELIGRVIFTVKDKLMVADPCYVDKDDIHKGINFATDDLGLLLGGCAGEWVAEVDYDTDFRRVMKLIVVRKKKTYLSSFSKIEIMAGVDSGQMFIGDSEMFGFDYGKLLNNYELPNGEWNYRLRFFGFGEGAVSSTGYGDGIYPVYVARDINQRVTRVEVLFDEDVIKDEEEFSWDE